jgi:hypothetical protein
MLLDCCRAISLSVFLEFWLPWFRAGCIVVAFAGISRMISIGFSVWVILFSLLSVGFTLSERLPFRYLFQSGRYQEKRYEF